MLHATPDGHLTPGLRAAGGPAAGAWAPNATGGCDPALVRALATAGGAGDFTATDALDAVAAFARRAHGAGHTTIHVTSVVRRSFAVAAPGAMTVLAYDALARCLVRHALYALHLAEGRGD